MRLAGSRSSPDRPRRSRRVASVSAERARLRRAASSHRRRGFLRLPGFRQMQRQQFRLLHSHRRIAPLQRARNPQMQQLPVITQQAVIGGIAQQRMGKAVAFIAAHGVGVEHAGLHQRGQRLVQRLGRHRGDRGEHVAPHAAPNHRGNLRDVLGDTGTIQPRHQQFMQRRRDRLLGDLEQRAVRSRFRLRQQHGTADLLDEQRHAVGLARNQPRQRWRNGPAAEQALHHDIDIGRRQRLELQHHRVTPADPRRVKTIPCRQHQQQFAFDDVADHPIEQLA